MTDLKEFITKKGIYIAIIAIVIAIISAISVALSGGNSSMASTLSQPLFKPIKSAMTSLVSSVEDLYDYMYKFDEVRAENEELKARVAHLEEEYREYTEISEENERLRRLLDFSERYHGSLDKEPVSIISWSASNFSSSFSISKGTSSGIELYDAVINDMGYLVGQVTEVTSSSSVVTTVIDTTMSVGAYIYESGETGLTTGDFQLFKEGKIKLSYLAEGSEVIIGNTVVTSGKGGVYPSGLVIGYIDGVSAGVSGLDSYAIIRPAADIQDCSHLYVITDFADSE